MSFKLSARADRDLHDALVRGILAFGEAQGLKYQAELRRVFEILAQFPFMARERLEYKRLSASIITSATTSSISIGGTIS